MTAPIAFLLTCVAITAAAVTLYAMADFRRRRQLRGLASGRQMHFSPHDRFRIAGQVARRFPVVGAAQATVSDVLYCRRDDRYCYVFRFDYTIGTVGPPRRRRVVVGYTEARDADAQQAPPILHVAPAELPMDAQYEHVLEALGARSEAPTANTQ